MAARVEKWYLASSSRGVSAHLVVRVVVTALESAPSDTAESSNSSRKRRSHIFKPTPGGREEGGKGLKMVPNKFKVDMSDRKIRARISVTEQAQTYYYIALKAFWMTHGNKKYC